MPTSKRQLTNQPARRAGGKARAIYSHGKAVTHVTSFRPNVEPLEVRQLLASDFTIALLPDTQYYSATSPAIFEAQTQWIAEHVQFEAIAFVSHTGDVVDRANDAIQWQRADAAFDRLDGDLLANANGLVPYSVVKGDHDFYPIGAHGGADAYTTYFGADRYTGRSWYGGSSPDGVNHFQLFSGGGYQFLHLTLEWEPRATSIDWAQSVIDAHPGMPTIVTTHHYLDGTGGHYVGSVSTDGLDGAGIFKYLVAPNPQIFLVLSGHVATERHTMSTNAAGLGVFEVMADYQDRPDGGQGWLQLLRFRPDLDRIEVTTYSPWLDQFESDANSQFTLELDFAERFNQNPPSPPMYLGFDVTVSLPGGVTAANEDIVAYNGSNYSLLFDGSDVGLAANRLSGFTRLSNNELLLSLASAQTLPGIAQPITATDIVKFTATTLGNATSGSFSLYFQGNDVGLTDDAEAIDAFHLLEDGRLLISTIGSASLPGITAADEDLIAFTPTSLGNTTSGAWGIYFDGSDVQLGSEDVDAVAVGGDGRIYLSVQDAFALTTLAGDDEDVFVFHPISLGSVTAGTYEPAPFFDGSLFGLTPYDVSGFDAPPGFAPAPNVRPTARHDVATVDEDASVLINVLADNGNGADWDVDGALVPSTTIAVVGPSNGSVANLGDGTFRYAPNVNFSGVDTFAYAVQDNLGAVSNLGIVTVVVSEINDPPLAQNDAVETRAGQPVIIGAILLNDSDVDGALVPSSVSASTTTHGSLVNNGDGTFLYTPQAGFVGADGFNYTVMDDDGVPSNLAAVTITVSGQPSPLLYFALDKNAVLPGAVSVANEDVATFDGTNFGLLFDGSDVGLSNNRLTAFTRLNDTELLFSLASAQSLAGIGNVSPTDVVKFTASSLGSATAGSFTLHFNGGDVGLSESGESIDAIEVLADGRLLISTASAASVPGVSAADEDILAFAPTSLGNTTAGTWAIYFDGSDVQLGSEDVDAVAVGSDGRIYLSVQDAFGVTTTAGDDEDVLVFAPTSLGSITAGSFESTLFFDGSIYGLANYDVIAVDIGETSISSLHANVSIGQADLMPGDFDGNRRIDLKDLIHLQQHIGIESGATPADGDLTGEGAINRADLAAFARLFGQADSSSPSAAAVVDSAQASARAAVTSQHHLRARRAARHTPTAQVHADATDIALLAISIIRRLPRPRPV